MAKEFLGQEYVVATNGKGLEQTSKSHRLLTHSLVTCSVVTILISAVMIYFCAAFFLSKVDGKSMMKTLNATGQNTDSALTYRLADPKRGDIIVSKFYLEDNSEPNDDQYNTMVAYPMQDAHGHYKYVIKRLIAMGGDQIAVERIAKVNYPRLDTDYNYYILLNGIRLREDYLDPEVGHHSALNFIQLWRVLNQPHASYLRADWLATDYASCVQNGVLTVPEGYMFYLGDNRGGNTANYKWSWDCAYLGPQSLSYCVGVCVDTINDQEGLPNYLWNKIVYYVFFGWAWQK